MKIENCKLDDIPQIFDMYRLATALMKSKKQVYWPEFSHDLVTQEINEGRQWKLLIDGQIACIWVTTLNDESIWGVEDIRPSLYIHRLATHPTFRGRNLAKVVLDWANAYGRSLNLVFLRMDTVGLNQGLITHYEKLGFQFLGAKRLHNTEGLPDHYQDGKVCYFQKKID